MKINISEINGKPVAEIISDRIELKDVQDALDLMADCSYQGAESIIINKKNIDPGFLI